MTLLQHDLTTLSGRSERQATEIGSGDWLFRLGIKGGAPFTYSGATFVVGGVTYSDHLGWQVGDYHQVEQIVNTTPENPSDMNVLSLKGEVQNPGGTPPGCEWVFQVIVAGFVNYQHTLTTSLFSLEDVKVPLFNLRGGIVSIQFRLILL